MRPQVKLLSPGSVRDPGKNGVTEDLGGTGISVRQGQKCIFFFFFGQLKLKGWDMKGKEGIKRGARNKKGVKGRNTKRAFSEYLLRASAG